MTLENKAETEKHLNELNSSMSKLIGLDLDCEDEVEKKRRELIESGKYTEVEVELEITKFLISKNYRLEELYKRMQNGEKVTIDEIMN